MKSHVVTTCMRMFSKIQTSYSHAVIPLTATASVCYLESKGKGHLSPLQVCHKLRATFCMMDKLWSKIHKYYILLHQMFRHGTIAGQTMALPVYKSLKPKR